VVDGPAPLATPTNRLSTAATVASASRQRITTVLAGVLEQPPQRRQLGAQQIAFRLAARQLVRRQLDAVRRLRSVDPRRHLSRLQVRRRRWIQQRLGRGPSCPTWANGLTESAVRRADFFVTGAVAAGGLRSFGLTTAGVLWGWGVNSDAGLGDGTFTTRPTPVPITTGIVAISSSHTHTLAAKSDGSLCVLEAVSQRLSQLTEKKS